jgi:hypothetical protein
VAASSPPPDGGEREQGHDQPGGQPDPAAQHAADPGWRLVLLDDLDLAVGPPLEHRGVVGVQQPGLGVQILDELIVGLGVGDVGVHPDIGHEDIDRHPATSSSRQIHRPFPRSCRCHAHVSFIHDG